MRRVQTNAELQALHAARAGFIFNDFTAGGGGAQSNVLHAADCTWVERMLGRARLQSRPAVRKVFFDTLEDAQSWLAANRGPEGQGWKRCATCWPDHMVPGNRLPARAGTPPATVSRAEARTGAASRAVPAPGPERWPAEAAFAMPRSRPLRLPVAPRLASWNKADDPGQARLAEYLAVADELLRPDYKRLRGPLAVRLDVGLPDSAGLLDHRDLDNYLFPLVKRLSQGAAGAIACAWGTKQHSASSYVRIEEATPAVTRPGYDCCYTVRTSASSQAEAFKEQIRDQLTTATPLPPGPVRMQLCFTVGPNRN
jgi:hypothetical protein